VLGGYRVTVIGQNTLEIEKVGEEHQVGVARHGSVTLLMVSCAGSLALVNIEGSAGAPQSTVLLLYTLLVSTPIHRP